MTDVITSSSNPKIKYIQSLIKKPDKRRSDNVYVVEGVRMVLDAPLSDIRCVYVRSELVPDSGATQSASDIASDNNDISLFLGKCYDNNIDVVAVSGNLLKHISQTVTPQGIVAIVRRREMETVSDKDTYLMLEDIQDPGNLGTLLRTAEAAGIDTVIMSRGCVDIYNPKVIRSTMGTIYRLPFYICKDEAEWFGIIRELKSDGVLIYGGSLRDSTNYADIDYTKRCAVVIGNEGRGITESTLDMIKSVHIPMHGDIESLNASVAGSILMYEINRQRLKDR